jgi:hypothetical protein
LKKTERGYMPKQSELDKDTFVGIALMVLAFLFIGPCIPDLIPGRLHIEPETVLLRGRETLMEMYPRATIIGDNALSPGSNGDLYGYEATYTLQGDKTIYEFYAEGND